MQTRITPNTDTFHAVSRTLLTTNSTRPRKCFREVLQINNDITYHPRNIQILLTKVFQTTKNLALQIMESMFNTRPKNYNLQYCQEFVTEKKRTVKNDIDTVSD